MPEDEVFARWVRAYNGMAFLDPGWSLLYLSVPKAAGTSLNIALTRSLGIPFPGRFLESHGEEPLVSQTVWDGWAGGRPMVESLDDAAFAAVMTAGLRHVFTVVRHPVERLLATWSSKYLVRAPYHRERIGLPDSGYRRFEDVEAVLADLDGLVAHLHANPALVHRDVHLVPQVELLRGDLSRFDHVGRTDRLPETVEWLAGRLAAEGASLHPVGHENDSPVRVDRSMVSARTLERIDDLYGRDYAFLGFEPDPPCRATGTLTADRLPDLNREIEHNVRAQVLHSALARANRPRRGLLTARSAAARVRRAVVG